MSDELFPPESVAMDSPKLAWLKRHKVLTYLSMPDDPDSRCWFAAFDEGEYIYENPADFFCQHLGENGNSRSGEGDTEDDAIAHLCRRSGLKLWNEN